MIVEKCAQLVGKLFFIWEVWLAGIHGKFKHAIVFLLIRAGQFLLGEIFYHSQEILGSFSIEDGASRMEQYRHNKESKRF